MKGAVTKTVIAGALIVIPFWIGFLPGVDTDAIAVNVAQLVSLLAGALLLRQVFTAK
jgi:hypothetical protein